MTYDFFANKSDKLNLLDFIFKETDLKVYDLASPYEQEVSEYKSTEEIASKFDLENGGQSSVTFQLWAQRFGGDILFRKIDLNPKSCGGHIFRYSTDGWGLIQLYLGGQKDGVLFHSHIGHFNENGALKWEDTNHFNGRTDKWNWKEIEQTSRKLKNNLHNKTAIRKIGSYGVLPGADNLSKTELSFGVSNHKYPLPRCVLVEKESPGSCLTSRKHIVNFLRDLWECFSCWFVGAKALA